MSYLVNYRRKDMNLHRIPNSIAFYELHFSLFRRIGLSERQAVIALLELSLTEDIKNTVISFFNDGSVRFRILKENSIIEKVER